MRRPLTPLALLALAAVPARADTTVPPAHSPGNADVKSIVIETGWVGLGRSPKPGLLRITRGPDGYTDGEKAVAIALVVELTAAANASAARITLDEAGLGGARRKELLPALRKDMEQEPWGKELDAKFTAAWLDPDRAQKALADYLQPGNTWTDDYPHAAVTITFADGRVKKLVSGQQKPLMIPWEIVEGKKTVGALRSARFSRAVAALLPPGFTERSRIAGEYLPNEIARHLHWQLEREFDEARKKAPAP